MNIHSQAQKEIEAILSSWDGHRFYWIHLKGEPGAGSSTLLRNIAASKNTFAYPVLRVSLPVMDAYETIFVRWLLQQTLPTLSTNEDVFATLPPVYRQWAKKTVEALRKGKNSPPEIYQKNVFYLFRWRLQEFPIIFILDDIGQTSTSKDVHRWEQWFQTFRKGKVLLFTAGHEVPSMEGGHPDYVLTLPGVTMNGAVGFLKEKYHVPELIARMMVNQLYLKSDGNLQKLHWLARTFFGDLLEKPSEKLTPEEFQRKVRPPSSPQVLFKAILEQLTLPQQQILGLFSRLDNPLTRRHVLQILRQAGIEKENFIFLEKEHFLETEHLAGNTFYYMKNSPLKEFVKQHVSGDLLLPFQDSLRALVKGKNWHTAPGFYRVLLDGGFLNGAIEVAYFEARVLVTQQRWGAVRELLHFLRRNLNAPVLNDTQRQDVLQWLVRYYDANGLTENYFEALREYRDSLNPKQLQQYLFVSLEMAEALMKMDAFGEARYFIREARATKIADPAAQFQSKILAGDLERLLGHPEYAYHQYREALNLLPRLKNAASKIGGLYHRFKKIREEGVAIPDQEEIIQQLLPIAEQNPFVYFHIQLDRIRDLMRANRYQQAFVLTTNLYRKVRWQVLPDALHSLDKLLGELWGALGKWSIAEFHLQRALNSIGFIADERVLNDVMIALGVVYKETARYRQALDVFQKVHEMAGIRNDFGRFVEAKLHLAHVHILTHNKFKAWDYIRSSLRMEDSLRDAALMLTAKLLAFSLEIQQNNWTAAANLLEECRHLTWQTDHTLDTLNLQFYEIQYLLHTQQVEEAGKQMARFRSGSQGLAKFAILSQWMEGKLLALQNQIEPALEKWTEAWQCAYRFGMWHLAFQVVLDFLELVQEKQLEHHQLPSPLPPAEDIYSRFMTAMDDEILQRQVLESDEGDRWRHLQHLFENQKQERGHHVR